MFGSWVIIATIIGARMPIVTFTFCHGNLTKRSHIPTTLFNSSLADCFDSQINPAIIELTCWYRVG